MGLRTLRFRNYDDDTQESQAAVQNAAELLATVPPRGVDFCQSAFYQ
jgi:hypothetical protein